MIYPDPRDQDPTGKELFALAAILCGSLAVFIFVVDHLLRWPKP